MHKTPVSGQPSGMHLPKQAFDLHHRVKSLVRIACRKSERLELFLKDSDLFNALYISEKHLIYLRNLLLSF